MDSHIHLELVIFTTIQEDSACYLFMELFYHSDKVVINVIILHDGPQGSVPLSVEGLFEINKNIVQVLLVTQRYYVNLSPI